MGEGLSCDYAQTAKRTCIGPGTVEYLTLYTNFMTCKRELFLQDIQHFVKP